MSSYTRAVTGESDTNRCMTNTKGSEGTATEPSETTAAENAVLQGIRKEYAVTEFAETVNVVRGSETVQQLEKRSGHIAETLKEHPDWRPEVERQIGAGEALKKMYPPAKPVEEMTLDEYKSYIWDLIGKIPLDSSHFKDDMTINISEEGFLTMKDDPEYESWLLGHNYMNLTFHNPWASFPQWTGTYGVDNFGASIEEHHGGSWSKSVPGSEKKYEEERGDGFWERRAKRTKERIKEQEKKALAKKTKKEQEEKAVMEAKILHQKMMSQYYNALAFQKMAGEICMVDNPLTSAGVAGPGEVVSMAGILPAGAGVK